jgi:elongation factor G
VKEFTAENIRNIAVIGHGGSGKTSLTEALLYASGATSRFGRVEEGTTVSDYHPDEIERKISINASLLFCEWKGKKINIIDTPGYADFVGEVLCSLRVVDTAVLVLKAVEGVEVGAEIAWGHARDAQTAVVLVVNKLNHENAKFERVVHQARERLGNDVAVLQFPVREGLGFDAVVDVTRMKLLRFGSDKKGKYVEEEIPAELREAAEKYHEDLIEKIAESDENLLTTFFEKGTLSDDDVRTGLREALKRRQIFPVLCAAGTEGIGSLPLLDFFVDFCPSPSEKKEIIAKDPASKKDVAVNPVPTGQPTLFVFKTVSEPHLGELSFFKVYSGYVTQGLDLVNESNGKTERLSQIYVMNGRERKEVTRLVAGDLGAVVKLKDTHTNNTLSSKAFPVLFPPIEFPEPLISVAIVAKSKGDEERIAAGLHALHEEDPTFLVKVEPELSQTVISGQGELHLTIIVKRLKEKYGVDVEMTEPRIPYRETIRGRARVQGKYKRQSGGRGQYGDVWLQLEPKPRGSGYEFVDAIVGGVVPGKYVPAVEKGVVETMQHGVLAGYPVVDVMVTLDDGSHHPVDSSDLAFKIAGSMAFKKAFMEAKPTLLEPIYEVEVIVPEEFMGDVLGDISSRRGKILGMDSESGHQKVRALVPLAELHKYSTVLRSMTQGRGIHRRKFAHYEEVPREITEKIVASAQKEKKEVEEEG